MINENAYELELPEGMGKAHPVFHVSLLKPYHSGAQERTPRLPLTWTIESEGQREFEVDSILAHRTKGKGKNASYEYLVQWSGYGPDHNSWVPESNLEKADWVLKRYWTLVETEERRRKPKKKR